ncbi:MAG: tyrosine-type recombinase/integrase [Planctomycetota bacterium]
MHALLVQMAVRRSVTGLEISSRVTTRNLRSSLATHLQENGFNVPTVQDRLRHTHVSMRMIPTHVLNRGFDGSSYLVGQSPPRRGRRLEPGLFANVCCDRHKSRPGASLRRLLSGSVATATLRSSPDAAPCRASTCADLATTFTKRPG